MHQRRFTENAAKVLAMQDKVIGVAVVGSWLTGELDEFSDVDMLIVTHERISHDKGQMTFYAKLLGKFLSGFTGEHVGEPRVLICLYTDPLLHVDLKFLTTDELHSRIEEPEILFDRQGVLRKTMLSSQPVESTLDLQWIEDRF